MEVTAIGFEIPGLTLIEEGFGEGREFCFGPSLGLVCTNVYAIGSHGAKEIVGLSVGRRSMPVVNKCVDICVLLLTKATDSRGYAER